MHALKGVDLTIGRGEFVSFIGPSGCGKTTFLRCVAASDIATGGSLVVNGMTPDQACGQVLWICLSGGGPLSLADDRLGMRLPLEIMEIERPEQAERVARVLEAGDLAGFEKKFPWQLSGGMQQRACIARALAFDADILPMDEPFGRWTRSCGSG